MEHNIEFETYVEPDEIESKWSDLGQYIELLTQENEMLEKDLIEKRRRRRERALNEKINATLEHLPSYSDYEFQKGYEDDIHTVNETIKNIYSSYEDVKYDLKNILNELQDFRKARSILESHLFQNS